MVEVQQVLRTLISLAVIRLHNHIFLSLDLHSIKPILPNVLYGFSTIFEWPLVSLFCSRISSPRSCVDDPLAL